MQNDLQATTKKLARVSIASQQQIARPMERWKEQQEERKQVEDQEEEREQTEEKQEGRLSLEPLPVDVRLSFKDQGALAQKADIPSEIRLHTLVLHQSKLFKRQLNNNSHHIVVKLPKGANEEDIWNFYTTIKLMHTKDWRETFGSQFSKAVGVLECCMEIEFEEGTAQTWQWLVSECHATRDAETMMELEEAYPELAQKYGRWVLSSDLQKDRADTAATDRSKPSKSSISRLKPPTTSINRRSDPTGLYGVQILNQLSQKPSSSDPYVRRPISVNSRVPDPTSTQPSHMPAANGNKNATPVPGPMLSTGPLPPTPTALYNHLTSPAVPLPQRQQQVQYYINLFETHSRTSHRHCQQRHYDLCFPHHHNHYAATMDALLTLAQQRAYSSPDLYDLLLRVLNVMKLDQLHEVQSHKYYLQALDRIRAEGGVVPRHPIPPPNIPDAVDVILHELITTCLQKREQELLVDYLLGETSEVNLSHLREIRGGGAGQGIDWGSGQRPCTDDDDEPNTLGWDMGPRTLKAVDRIRRS